MCCTDFAATLFNFFFKRRSREANDDPAANDETAMGASSTHTSTEEVRYQTGAYAEAFCSHKKKRRYGEETIGGWKDALTVVAGINGSNLQSMPNRREGEFVKAFTQMVFNDLSKAYLGVSDCLVNVDNHVDAIMEMIGLDLLRRYKGKKKVEALRLKLDHQRQYRFTYKGFESLSDLRGGAIWRR
ncbi:hypothetical protein NL676_019867 [Syzygium grande]|nr:hypothetical protein NL676_019867 [Syzygium grande]